MPCEAHEVEATDIQEMMPPADYFDAWQKGDARSWPPPPENPEPGEPPDVELRFKVGDRVECCIAQGARGVGAGHGCLALVQSPAVADRSVRAVPDQAGQQREPDLRPAGQGQLHQGSARGVSGLPRGGCARRSATLQEAFTELFSHDFRRLLERYHGTEYATRAN